jgi:hypothetical protein
MTIKFTGRATITADSLSLRTSPGAGITIGGLTADSVMTDQGVHGYTEKWEQCIITGEVCHAADTDLVKLQAARGITVQFETDTGVVFTSLGVCTKVGELKNGKFPITYEGTPAKAS